MLKQVEPRDQEGNHLAHHRDRWRGKFDSFASDFIVRATPKRRDEMNEVQKEWCARACKEHDAYNIHQVIQLLGSFGEFRSEAAVFEVCRLMKNDPYTYGSCFKNNVCAIDKVAEAMKKYKRPSMDGS